MPQLDRRIEVSEAAWKVIVREGLDRTSIRAIARELDCTTGVVTHYFRDKQELILYALDRVTEKLKQAMQEVAERPVSVDRLVEMLCAFLPLDNKRQEILKVWIAFLGYAVGRESLMLEHQTSAGQLREIIIRELEALQSAKIIRQGIDTGVEANTLLALVNGIALDSLIQKKCLNSKQQKMVIQRYFNGITI
ncbi:TetR/AcrR family transcriptional regulator [Calothrix rhizosoleniae]|uniref:TetR/AcrR family transcriptional regulator n=1 Tax=Calothrix rhizosoleniae TaxID=888997 RepID=UPI000B49DB52|nr:TetR/AcrR family transcriptional regulator [Calothrix rhizosoleniae]